jgi:hypothetical protein
MMQKYHATLTGAPLLAFFFLPRLRQTMERGY